MIRRTLMRRAYNGGRWAKARAIADKLLHIPKEQDLARSVIIRSLYNEGKFDELIELNDLWGNRFDYLLEKMNNCSPTLQQISQDCRESNWSNLSRKLRLYSMKNQLSITFLRKTIEFGCAIHMGIPIGICRSHIHYNKLIPICSDW